ncbi:ComEA family DNA-binding protein [Desulfurivibrio alkaliphilus]|uniref:Helix-hairpin-helix motif protein n=1 Tax=Desulfurivibrio alkaliphilus (strain DSM 19089 / UNIQEM U267 / AHT2) TaxID=589865 RepID=D6Z1T5_DESAT|nr:helix-hairpin-helix domain-containing protein [Desulfurivibrio alkaliphilus]ADH85510.1 helix-hairpin-helix motif protein [Desulfurivibrio alkaliphilus AHT 2]
MERENLSRLLLLLLGLGLWLAGWSALGSSSPAAGELAQYRWLADSQRPAGIYRLPAAAAAADEASVTGGTFNSRIKLGANTPPHLALFTFQPLAVNRADARTLRLLPGIGPTLAGRIVEYRTSHGSFQSPEELLQVQGIGPKTLAAIRPLITID